MIYDELMERLTVYFTGPRYHDEVVQARREFFDDAGIMDETNNFYEMRVTQFLEWYMFTRRLNGTNLTPVQQALQAADYQMSEVERPHYENLASSRHSLFEFLKIRGEDIYVRDLFTDKKLIIKGSPIRIGFSREELFDTRLIPHDDSFVFTKGFCFHPAEAAKFILSEVKKLRKSDVELQEALMLRLLKMRYKFEQYRHLKLEHVYTNDRKVRF